MIALVSRVLVARAKPFGLVVAEPALLSCSGVAMVCCFRLFFTVQVRVLLHLRSSDRILIEITREARTP